MLFLQAAHFLIIVDQQNMLNGWVAWPPLVVGSLPMTLRIAVWNLNVPPS